MQVEDTYMSSTDNCHTRALKRSSMCSSIIKALGQSQGQSQGHVTSAFIWYLEKQKQ